MATVSTLPRSTRHGDGFTRADLDAMPDDGNRYELIDGAIIVTPSPAWPHQRILRRLAAVLDSQVPEDLEVFFAPLDVTLGDDTIVEPDLLVVRPSDLGERDLEGIPLLVVEIHSPSTRWLDLGRKRERYEAAGVPSYWVIDPESLTLTAWELREGTYTEVAQVTADEVFEAGQPFPVSFSPSKLRRQR